MTQATFLVGGAVRDLLLGFDPQDKDYVVVGFTEEEMLTRGFTKVGADFPVFLHPVTGDEYAMARREKKTGEGYLGFTSEFGVDVTLEEDCGRRDLTINSIAMDKSGNYVDPFGGKDDLHAKIFRHTSNAFAEDPVRVLRLARLRARYGAEWKVAPETQALISEMSKKGVLSELQGDRIWKEMSRALMEPFPRLFFDTLLQCDALHTVFPEVYKLLTALEAFRWHPEGNAYEHTMLVLTQAAQMNFDLESRYACLVHDFGKGLTKFEHLPRHFGHDVNGVPVVEAFSNRVRVPAKMRDRACKATKYHMRMHDLHKLTGKAFVKMFDDMGVLNDRQALTVLFNVGQADERGRLGSENNPLDHLNAVFDKFEAYRSVSFAQVFPNGSTDVNKIKQGMYNARVKAVHAA